MGASIKNRYNLTRISFLKTELSLIERTEMSKGIPQDYQEILDQIHSNVFLERLKDHFDSDGRRMLNERDASELIDLVRRLRVQDASPSIDRDAVEMLLGDEEIRDDLFKATRAIMKSNTENAEKEI